MLGIAAIAGLFVVVVAALWFFQDRMIFPAPRGPVPAATGDLALEMIETTDGERLSALWHAPEPGEPTILFLHGNGTAIAQLAPLGEAWASLGAGFLTPAWRGYPGSTGRPSEAGLLLDAEAAYDFVRARTDGPIVIYGQSLGSGVAVHLATVRDALALVLEAPYDSVLAVASGRFRFAPVGTLLRHTFRSDQRIGEVEAPILIVHGTADRVIPISHGRALLSLAPAGAEFHEVEGATHFDIGARAFKRVTEFVDDAFRRAVETETVSR